MAMIKASPAAMLRAVANFRQCGVSERSAKGFQSQKTSEFG
jgi:hypothetical protein